MPVAIISLVEKDPDSHCYTPAISPVPELDSTYLHSVCSALILVALKTYPYECHLKTALPMKGTIIGLGPPGEIYKKVSTWTRQLEPDLCATFTCKNLHVKKVLRDFHMKFLGDMVRFKRSYSFALYLGVQHDKESEKTWWLVMNEQKESLRLRLRVF